MCRTGHTPIFSSLEYDAEYEKTMNCPKMSKVFQSPGRSLLSFPEAWPEAPPSHGALLKKPFPVPARRVVAR